MSLAFDPVIALSLLALVCSLVVMACLVVIRRRRTIRPPEPTLRMNRLALQALEETLPVAHCVRSTEQDVRELPALSQSQADRVVAGEAIAAPFQPTLYEPPPSDPVPLVRPSERHAPEPAPLPPNAVAVRRPLADLSFEDGDDAPTRIDDQPFSNAHPEIPPPARVPRDLFRYESGPPPVPPASDDRPPAPLPVYRRSTRIAHAGARYLKLAATGTHDHAPSSDDRPPSSPPPSFNYGDRLRRA